MPKSTSYQSSQEEETTYVKVYGESNETPNSQTKKKKIPSATSKKRIISSTDIEEDKKRQKQEKTMLDEILTNIANEIFNRKINSKNNKVPKGTYEAFAQMNKKNFLEPIVNESQSNNIAESVEL